MDSLPTNQPQRVRNTSWEGGWWFGRISCTNTCVYEGWIINLYVSHMEVACPFFSLSSPPQSLFFRSGVIKKLPLMTHVSLCILLLLILRLSPPEICHFSLPPSSRSAPNWKVKIVFPLEVDFKMLMVLRARERGGWTSKVGSLYWFREEEGDGHARTHCSMQFWREAQKLLATEEIHQGEVDMEEGEEGWSPTFL